MSGGTQCVSPRYRRNGKRMYCSISVGAPAGSIVRPAATRLLTDQPKLAPGLRELVQGPAQLLPRVTGGERDAHQCAAGGDGGRYDRIDEDALVVEPAPHLEAALQLAHHDGDHGGLGRPGVEAERIEPLFHETRVVPQPFDALRLVAHHVERGQHSGDAGRRSRSRKDEWARVMLEV